MKALLLSLSLLVAAPAHSQLKAAAGKVDISPDLKKHKVYLAGYGAKGRRPIAVHDPLHARIAVVSDGKKTLAIVGLDLLGFYRRDVEDLRRRTGYDKPGKFLLAASTHDHAGPDTLGLWGPFIGVSGVNHAYHEELKTKIAAKLAELESKLEPVTVAAAETKIDPRRLCRDLRDPVVIDPWLGVMTLNGKGGKRVATVVNWSCHPEVLDKHNMLMSADFPGPLCDRVEEKTGGACVYLSGSIGGLMSPDIEDGKENFYEAQRIGATVADHALKLAASAQPGGATLDFSSTTFRVQVENSRYLLFLPALTFGHDLLDGAGKKLSKWKAYWLPLRHIVKRLGPNERPWIETQVSRVDLGPVRMLGIPGEIFPELVVGGYDGRYAAGGPVTRPTNPNPPDLKKAPAGPYLRDLIKAPTRFVVGLANDELGYIVPEYDFSARPNLAMHPRMPGHHYEETNSIGPSATGLIRAAAQDILKR